MDDTLDRIGLARLATQNREEEDGDNEDDEDDGVHGYLHQQPPTFGYQGHVLNPYQRYSSDGDSMYTNTPYNNPPDTSKEDEEGGEDEYDSNGETEALGYPLLQTPRPVSNISMIPNVSTPQPMRLSLTPSFDEGRTMLTSNPDTPVSPSLPSGGSKTKMPAWLKQLNPMAISNLFFLRDVMANKAGPPGRKQKITDTLGSVKELFKWKPPSPPSTAQTLGSFGHLRLSQASFIPENRVNRRRSTSAPSSPRPVSMDLPNFSDPPHEFTDEPTPNRFKTLPSSSARPRRPPPPPSSLLMVPGMDGEGIIPPISPNYQPRPRHARFRDFDPVLRPPNIQTQSYDPPHPSSTHALPRTLDERQFQAIMDSMTCHLQIVHPPDGRASAHVNTHSGGRSYEASMSSWYTCVNPKHVEDQFKRCQQLVEIPFSVNLNLNNFFSDRENWQRQCIRDVAQELGHHLG
ncbi:hypothetical protein H1R20_g11582, partial [Candolleomyces eurysporus]